jgi:hypothetical protein
MTSNKVTIIETEKPISSKTKVQTATDDANTESYHTSGKSFIYNILLSEIYRYFVEVIRMINQPTHVRCINTPNGSTAGDTSTSSACKSNQLKIVSCL